MPILPSPRLGAVRLALAGAVLVLAPAAAEAFAARIPQRAGVWPRQQAQRAMPARIAKRAPAKVQAKNPPAAKPAETKAAAKPSERAGTWTAGEPGGRACFRSRRKLWQEDEGWVVKKVNVCP